MRRRKSSASKWNNHAEIRRLLESGRYSLRAIGRRLGLSGERVRQIHDQLYPGDDWTARRQAIRDAAARPMGGWSPTVLYVWREAERRGLRVEKMKGTNGAIMRGALQINGKPAIVHRTATRMIPTGSKRFYHLIHVPRGREGHAWVLVCVQGKKRSVFIIPWTQVAKRSRVYIPLEGWSGYHNHGPITDWFRFKDNWRPFMTGGVRLLVLK